MDLLRSVEMEQFKSEIPAFSVGDRLRVNIKIVEGDKSRVQAFEGVVIAKKHGSISETFTVRRVTYGEGVERTFPIHSPTIDSIEVLSRGKVRRAKLYYLRSKSGKASRIKEVRL
ncbi:MAG: 50S ribosomal protein L19 [Candidatus Poribacteria bacterium]